MSILPKDWATSLFCMANRYKTSVYIRDHFLINEKFIYARKTHFLVQLSTCTCNVGGNNFWVPKSLKNLYRTSTIWSAPGSYFSVVANRCGLFSFSCCINPTKSIFIAVSCTPLVWVTKCSSLKVDWWARSIIVEQSRSRNSFSLSCLIRYLKRSVIIIAICIIFWGRSSVVSIWLSTAFFKALSSSSKPKRRDNFPVDLRFMLLQVDFHVSKSDKTVVARYRKGVDRLAKIVDKHSFWWCK